MVAKSEQSREFPYAASGEIDNDLEPKQFSLWAGGSALAVIAALILDVPSTTAKEPRPMNPGAVPRTAVAGASAKSLPDTPTGDGHPSIDPAASQIRQGDWNQWSGSSSRDSTPEGKNIPTEWKVGDFDQNTGMWKKATSKNIKWAARLGSNCFVIANPVVANGKVFMGTNNANGYLDRYPPSVDLGVLLCFDEADGKFLWQDSSEKLPSGRANDWPNLGICSAPLVEGHRLWYVTSRGEVKCLDTIERKPGTTDEPKVIWSLDMMKQLGVRQHNMCCCSVTAAGDLLFVGTSNGVDSSHLNIPCAVSAEFPLPRQEHRQGLLGRQLSRQKHLARSVVVARLRRARRRAAGDLRCRGWLGL